MDQNVTEGDKDVETPWKAGVIPGTHDDVMEIAICFIVERA